MSQYIEGILTAVIALMCLTVLGGILAWNAARKNPMFRAVVRARIEQRKHANHDLPDTRRG
jgi:hypothetical protein